MASSWEKKRLGDFISIAGGFSYKGKFVGEGESLLLGMGAVSFNKRFLISGARKYSGDYPDKHLAKVGDLIIATRQQSENLPILGYPAKVPAELEGNQVVVGTNLYKVFNESSLENDFIFWLMRGPQYLKHIKGRATGTTVKMITKDAVEDFVFDCPPPEERKSIYNFLDAIEDKIELIAKTNQTLEQMAQAVFKSWFVDFDPVIDNALAAGNNIPEALKHKAEQREQAQQLLDFKPLPEHIRALFPSEFEQTEESTVGFEGWIPKGWNCKAVSEAIIINPRVSMPKGTVAKFADMKAVPTSGYMINEVIEKEFKGGSKFQKNDVILARITPCLENGKTALVDFLQDNEVGFGSTEFIVLRENGAVNYPFIACLARDDNFRQHCIQNMVGSSGRQRVQNSCFDFYHLALPENERILNIFHELTKPSFDKMIINKDEINTLVKVRDTLLPKLISGEITINKEVA